MTKRFIVAAVAAVAITAGTAGAQAQKVGFINAQGVLASIPAARQAQETLQREATGYRTQIDSLERALQQRQQQLEQRAGTMTEQARTQQQQELQQQFQQYQQRVNQLQQTAQGRETQLMQPILQQLQAAIEAERAAGGYTYIMDAGASFVVAVDPAVDITTRVITRMGGTPPARQ